MVKRIIHAVKRFFGSECRDECCRGTKASRCCEPVKKKKSAKKTRRK